MKYESILYYSHYEPKYHPRMSKENRAGQFSAFAALTGYDDTISEASRRVEDPITLAEDSLFLLQQKFSVLLENLSNHPEVKVYYFEKDLKKEGGSYQTYCGKIKKIDFISQEIVFEDSKKIYFSQIMDLGDLEEI